MRVQEVMARDPKTCRANDTLVAAARILWDHDCGCVPVVDDQGRPVGIVTDRDACMAAYTRGRRLDEIAVHGAMARTLFTCRADDGLAQAVALMQQKQVRRLPVVDERGRLCGVLSIADALRAAVVGRDLQAPVLGALAAIAAPRQLAKKPEAVAVVVPKAPGAPAPGAMPTVAPPAPAGGAPASAGGAPGKQDKTKKR
jgi:CBS domain-containing protein